MPAHIQSHWIAVRRRMFTSDDWAEYWREMPMIESYDDSVMLHESRFTSHWFASGASPAPWRSPPTATTPRTRSWTTRRRCVRDGCPIVKRRAFFYDPLYTRGARAPTAASSRG